MTHVTSRSCITPRASPSETAAALLREGALVSRQRRCHRRAAPSERTYAQFTPYTSPTLKPGCRSKSFATQVPRIALSVLPKMTFIFARRIRPSEVSWSVQTNRRERDAYWLRQGDGRRSISVEGFH